MGRIPRDKKVTGTIAPREFKWFNDCDVYICDASDQKMTEMVEYCENHGLKLVSFDNTDVSDCSGQWDMIARFRFDNTEDALIFKLTFK